MTRSLSFLFGLALVLLALPAFAAEVSYEMRANQMEFVLTFQKGYSYFETRAVKNELGQDEMVIFFESSEEIAFKEDFYDNPVKSAWIVTGEGMRKRFHFSFDPVDALIEPEVNSSAQQSMRITFTFPSTVAEPAPSSAVPGVSAYMRMFAGLFVILAVILLSYGLMRRFFKNSVITDIPGIGRMLGKIDIEMKKSLVFYELGEIIYILGVTESGISVVDKITDPVDVNLLKSGFSRRKDFSSYLKFFRKNEVKEDVKDTSDLLEEKLSSLRKK